MSYATVAELRTYLPQVKAGAGEDALLQTILDRAQEVVTGLLGFEFAAWPAAATELDVECSHGGRWLEIPHHKAATVASVESVSGRGSSSESTEAVDDWIEESDGRLYLDAGWGQGWYRVGAIWGYGPAPADAVQLELQIAVNIWRGRDATNFANVVGVEGQGAVNFSRAVSWSERSLAENIRTRYLGVVFA